MLALYPGDSAVSFYLYFLFCLLSRAADKYWNNLCARGREKMERVPDCLRARWQRNVRAKHNWTKRRNDRAWQRINVRCTEIYHFKTVTHPDITLLNTYTIYISVPVHCLLISTPLGKMMSGTCDFKNNISVILFLCLVSKLKLNRNNKEFRSFFAADLWTVSFLQLQR